MALDVRPAIRPERRREKNGPDAIVDRYYMCSNLPDNCTANKALGRTKMAEWVVDHVARRCSVETNSPRSGRLRVAVCRARAKTLVFEEIAELAVVIVTRFSARCRPRSWSIHG